MSGTSRCRPKMELIFSTIKPLYLKIPSTAMLNATAEKTAALAPNLPLFTSIISPRR